MSEKRFVIDIYTLPTTIVDSETSEPYSSMRSVVGLLNELNDENKKLKKENDDLRTTITKQVEANNRDERPLIYVCGFTHFRLLFRD